MSDNIQKNRVLIERYPFLLPRNRWTGEVSKDYDYHYTELDAMPDGWRIAFGEQICEEIRFGATEKILREIIPKYSKLSQRTCIKCGKPATKISLGWISPWCDECADKIKRHERFESVETYFKTCEDCAYYDTDEDDMPCCGCVDKINFEPMEVQNDEQQREFN